MFVGVWTAVLVVAAVVLFVLHGNGTIAGDTAALGAIGVCIIATSIGLRHARRSRR